MRYAKDATVIDEERAQSLITNVEQLMDRSEEQEKNQNKHENEPINEEEKCSIEDSTKNDSSEEKLSM